MEDLDDDKKGITVKMMMKFFRVSETGSSKLAKEIILDDLGMAQKYNFDTGSIEHQGFCKPCWRDPDQLVFVESRGTL